MKTEAITSKFGNYELTYDDSPEAKEELFQRCIKWFKKQESYSGECIMQSDDPQIEAPWLMSDLADDVLKFEQKYEED